MRGAIIDICMAIDDPKAAFEKQYLDDYEERPMKIALSTAKLAFPGAAIPVTILQKVLDQLLNPISIRERLAAMWKMLLMEFEHVENTKANRKDVEEAIQLALRRDAEAFNDKKRERYVKLIGNALRSETQIQDVTTLVQTIEQLGERDLTVLKVINKIMNKPGDWRPQKNPGIGDVMKVHPNVFTERAQEFAAQIAIALGQKTDANTFSREEGYMVCARLQGFGLAHEIPVSPRELPLTNYSFRLSVQGMRLLKLLDEDVPNFDRYFDAD
jgi:hypothetical protein